MTAQLREASSVVLLRRAGHGFDVFLLRRKKGASFMPQAYVFPGGGAEPDEDARTTAARELFEEAGVLFARDITVANVDTLESPTQGMLRKRILEGQNATAVLAAAGLAWATENFVPWSHWITPSAEGDATSKRFSARFFIAELPAGQEPQFDDIETVDQMWVSPQTAIERAGELALPPPQVRTCWELSQLATVDDVFDAARVRSEEPHPILPRLATMKPGDGPTLLLPWDADYTVTGTGEAAPMTYRASWMVGPSRFIREQETKAWRHVDAPGSTPAA